MSKNIYLYSEDKKYKCAIELAESLDRLGCPDHSMIILFEERDNGTYVIAQASDKLLETEKDQQIAELKKQLEGKDKEIKYFESEWQNCQQKLDHYVGQYFNLQAQLHSQPKEIVEKIRNMCCIEDKAEDGTFVLGINEKELYEILKEYGEMK